jgi:hypothetical protein
MAVTEPAAGDTGNPEDEDPAREETVEDSPEPVYDAMIRRPESGPDPLGREPLTAPDPRKGKK